MVIRSADAHQLSTTIVETTCALIVPILAVDANDQENAQGVYQTTCSRENALVFARPRWLTVGLNV
jgi:hypothetical protein